MRASLQRIALTSGLCLVLALTLVAPNAIAKKKKSQALAAYSGRTINTTPGAARSTNFVNLEIHRWTTDEERQGLGTILVEKGSEAMVKSMRDD